jgi:soluble lytic murein transglycosylase-like protein
VSDVRGVPVPGVAGVAPHPSPRRADFRALLEQLMPSQRGAAARLRAPVRLRQPTFQPRLGPARPVALRQPSREAEPAAAPRARQALRAAIRHAAATAGIEPALSLAVARAESSLNPQARSPDGQSVGTFQVTHATAAEMRRKIARGTVERPPGVDDVALGVGYLRYLHDLFGRRARLARGLETVPIEDTGERRLFAVAAFNAGEGRVARAQARAAAGGGDPTRFADVRPFLPPITQAYVTRVVGFAREESPPTVV